MSSLIDVSFLLLIYFLITSTLDPKEADLASNFTPEPPIKIGGGMPTPISIGISADGMVSVDGEVLDADATRRELPNLREKLDWARQAFQLSNPTGSYGVIVRADNEASGQRFIDVMNCLAETGINNVALDGFAE